MGLSVKLLMKYLLYHTPYFCYLVNQTVGSLSRTTSFLNEEVILDSSYKTDMQQLLDKAAKVKMG